MVENMDQDKINIIARTDFFKDVVNDVENVEQIADNKLKIDLDKLSYVLGFYPINDYDKLVRENSINNYLSNIGLDSLDLYEIGIMPDINKSYKVFEYRKESSLKDFLNSSSNEENYKMGLKFGKILKNLHLKKVRDFDHGNWYKNIQTKLNLLLYRQGLNKNNDLNDYILIDYLNDNLYICQNTSPNILYQNLSDKNIRVYDDKELDIRALKEIKIGDGVSDFVNINKIAIDHPDFARGVLHSYHKGELVSRKFYRLLSFYQAFVILKSLIDIREKKKSYLNEDQIKQILDFYGNFSDIVPSWAK